MFGENTEEKEYEALQEGNYTVVLNNCTLDETGNHPMINAEFSIIAGPDKNRKLWKRFYVSEGTCAKFLPWQFGIMGFKKELDEKNCTSYEDTARNAMTLMGGVIGTAFKVDVSITQGQNGKEYNDLVITEKLLDNTDVINHSDVSTATTVASANNVTNHAPSFDKDEPLPF